MNESTAGTPTANYTTTSPRGLFGTKLPSSISFLVGILLFLLPFVEIKCNTLSIQKLTGFELATGYHLKSPGNDNTLVGTLENTDFGKGSNTAINDKRDANIYALIAMALGVLGLVFSLTQSKAGISAAMICGGLAVAGLIALFVDVRSQVSSELKGGDMQMGTIIRVDFTPWFYISLLAFLAAVVFSYRRMKPNPTAV